jgi:hypothetical protein
MGASQLTTVAERARVHRSGMRVEGTPHCDLCHRPAVHVAGTSGRYFCLICRQHLPYKPAA